MRPEPEPAPSPPSPGDTNIASRPEPVRFRITPDMVDRFAGLSGDRSSLHTDAAFARRSMYRGTVVHGFLPLLFLSVVDWSRLVPFRPALKELAATFLKPVYPGEDLILSVTTVEVRGPRLEIEFEIAIPASRTLVTTGTAVVIPDDGSPSPPRPESRAAALPVEVLAERTLELDAIERADEASFGFVVSPDAVQALQELIAEGRDGLAPAPAGAPGLLAASLLSTLIGMYLPGRAATFLGFTLSFEGPIETDRPYRLIGRVTFKSSTTSTIAEEVVIVEEPAGAARARGKAHVRVNAPPASMPTLEALREDGLDLGLRGKVVLVTGGSRGIGETIAKLFAVHGARVAVNYLHSDADARRVVEELSAGGHDGMSCRADVSDREQVRRMIAGIRERYGTIDVLVNNAVADAQPLPFLETTWERMQRDLEVVLGGAFHCCQEVLPHMVAQGGGRIINLATAYVDAPPANQAKYVVAKSALVGLTRSIAVEFARHNVLANLVLPAMVETDLSRHVPRIVSERMKADTPLQRLATPAEVAKAVVFLASSLSTFTTGQKIMVTGGAPPLL